MLQIVVVIANVVFVVVVINIIIIITFLGRTWCLYTHSVYVQFVGYNLNLSHN